MLTKLKNDILDLIFPPRCLNCDKLGSFVCSDCSAKIIRIRDQHCPFCHLRTKTGDTCPKCFRKHHLRGAIALGYFHDPVLKKIIHHYKYEGISAAGGELAQLLLPLIRDFDLLISVPVSSKRLRERGYNQAEILAERLGSLTDMPVYRGLKKRKHTKRQVGLRRGERLANLQDAFFVPDATPIRGKRILLVDDVLTTGATLDSCAEVLGKAGAKEVWGLVLARE